MNVYDTMVIRFSFTILFKIKKLGKYKLIKLKIIKHIWHDSFLLIYKIT